MSLLASIVLVIHLLIAVAICGFVLLQHGKGADMGAAFGSGSSGSVFGSAGSANFLSRSTGILAFLFFVSSVGLTIFGSMHARSTSGGLMDSVVVPSSSGAPAPAKSGAGLSGAASVPAKAGDPAGSSANPGAASAPASGTAAVPAASPAPATQPRGDSGNASKSSEVPK